MTYSNFSTADDVSRRLGIEMRLTPGRFASVGQLAPSPWLRETLNLGRTRAGRSNTEKARSEWLIAPILTELEEQIPTIAVFSGRPLRSANLSGTPDFIIATNTGGIALTSPIFAVVEAKRDDFEYGAAQCVATLTAAREMNGTATALGGAVTNGTIWQFLELDGASALIDDQIYNALDADLPQILGVLAFFCRRDVVTIA